MSVTQAWGEVRQRLFDLLKDSWKFWPWVNFANLFMVPLKWRVLWIDLAGFFWNTYLNWYAHHVGDHEISGEGCKEVEKVEVEEGVIDKLDLSS